MSTSVLFDVPGPRTRRRHRLYSAVFAVVFLAVTTFVVWKLWQEGNFERELFEDLSQENVWRAIGQGVAAPQALAKPGEAAGLCAPTGQLSLVGALEERGVIDITQAAHEGRPGDLVVDVVG